MFCLVHLGLRTPENVYSEGGQGWCQWLDSPWLSESQYPDCDTVTYAGGGGGDLITIMGNVSTYTFYGQAAHAGYFTRNFCSKSGQYSEFRRELDRRIISPPASVFLSGPWELFGFHSKLFRILDEKSLTPLQTPG